ERSAKGARRCLISARGVDRMEEVDNPPPAAGLLEAFLQPGQLLGVECAAVEDVETNTAAPQPAEGLIAAPERVVARLAQVEVTVSNLRRNVVVPYRRPKCDAAVQKCLVRALELRRVVLGRVTVVDVVAQHEHEVERKCGAQGNEAV